MKMKLEIQGLENIGMDKPFTSDLLTDEVNKLIKNLRTVMEDERVFASYALVQSIEPEIVSDNEMTIKMNKYATYVNEGVKGVKDGTSYAGYAYKNKKPPYSAFVRWDEFKVLSINPYAMANHIYYHGIRPRQYIEKAIVMYQNQ